MSDLLSATDALARRLGLASDAPLLRTALTHSSYAAENGVVSNERLEFLGDAVVDLVVTDAIIRDYPSLDQGTGSLARSKVVNEATLAEAAERLGVAHAVLLGRGEQKSQGAFRPSQLADTFEALVAAVYLDRGYEAARDFVLGELGDALRDAAATPDEVDPKSRLRQWAEARGLGAPTYRVDGEGPSHATLFAAQVFVNGVLAGTGSGRSKKAAEVAAALAAWEGRNDA